MFNILLRPNAGDGHDVYSSHSAYACASQLIVTQVHTGQALLCRLAVLPNTDTEGMCKFRMYTYACNDML